MEHQMEGYAAFLQAKAQKNTGHGFEPLTIPDHLFDYQKELTAWSIRQGRSAIFADCGMGKTFMELAWATNVHRKTGKPVLLLTPLAVGRQIVTEGERYGYEASQSRNGKVSAPITVSNYEQLQDGLPLTWCPLCDAPADHDGQCFPALPAAAGVE